MLSLLFTFGGMLFALIGFAMLAFVNTSVLLVRYRAIGVSSQLATTPVRRTEFLLACLSARLGLGFVQIVLLLLLAALSANHSAGTLVRVGVLLFSGLLALLSLGCLIGARFQNPDRAMSFAFIAVLVSIATSDVVLPFEMMPRAITSVLSWIPTTAFSQSLAAELVGATSTMPLWVVVVLLLGTAGAVFTFSSRVFVWDSANE